jgi:hypothetical protein
MESYYKIELLPKFIGCHVLENNDHKKTDENVGLSHQVPQAGLEPALALLQTGF